MSTATADFHLNTFVPLPIWSDSGDSAKHRAARRLVRNQKAMRAKSADMDSSWPDTAAVGSDQIAAAERLRVIQSRMLGLAQVYFEDYSKLLDAQSEAGFMCLMEYNPGLSMPLISAESTGLVTATWMKDAECLSLRFTDRHRLDFALTYVVNGSIKRKWGPSNLVSLFESFPKAKLIATGA